MRSDLSIGLDVSLDQTSVCVVDENGGTVWRGRCKSTPDDIAATVQRHAPDVARVGLECGQLSTWLFHELKARGLPVVCIDARHAKAALSLKINKTDANDAYGIAQIIRVGWYKEVTVKSMDTHAVRALLAARTQLVCQLTTLKNTVRGILKTFGLIVPTGSGRQFERARPGDDRRARRAHRRPHAATRDARRVAPPDRPARERCGQEGPRRPDRALMTAPGVGAVVALAFTSAIEDPARFRRSSSVGAYLGLTPRRHQSGEVDRAGRISRCGDGLVRSYLYEAACTLIKRCKRPCPLRRWGLSLIDRVGSKKVYVAVARKLAVILHQMWRDNSTFCWDEERLAAA
jgi:transposase